MKKTKMILTIEAEFGSQFQKEVHVKSLFAMVEVWKAFMLAQHKDNRVKGEIEFDPS